MSMGAAPGEHLQVLKRRPMEFGIGSGELSIGSGELGIGSGELGITTELGIGSGELGSGDFGGGSGLHPSPLASPPPPSPPSPSPPPPSPARARPPNATREPQIVNWMFKLGRIPRSRFKSQISTADRTHARTGAGTHTRDTRTSQINLDLGSTKPPQGKKK